MYMYTHADETMAQTLAGPTVLCIEAFPVRTLTELKIKSGLFDMIRRLLFLKRLTLFNSILNLELFNFSLKMCKCKNTNQNKISDSDEMAFFNC